jgi:magnesium-transporting ATPase (P-type)
MGKGVTIWGVGLKFTLLSVLCFVLALVVHTVWYPLFVIQGIPYVILVVISLILISIGVPIWIAASNEVDRAFEAGELATQGVYATLLDDGSRRLGISSFGLDHIEVAAREVKEE